MNRNSIAGILTIIVGGLVYYQAARIPPPNFGDPVGAGSFPKFWACILVLLGAILIVAEMLRGRQAGVVSQSLFSAEKIRKFGASYRNVIIVFVLLLAQVWVMRSIGFALSSVIFIPACAYILGAKKPKTLSISAVVGALVVAGLYCFFVYGMKMPLPA